MWSHVFLGHGVLSKNKYDDDDDDVYSPIDGTSTTNTINDILAKS